MAVRRLGEDDRATVDLGPRSELRPGEESDAGPGDAGDLGDDDLGGDGDGDGDAPEAEGTNVDAAAVRTPTVTAHAIHVQATQRLPAARRGLTESARLTTTTTTPSDAMRVEELSRTAIFVRIAILTAIAGLGVAFFTNGDPVAFRLLEVGCIVTAAGSFWMLHIVNHPETYSSARVLPSALVIAVGAFGGVYYWGVASPVAAMITYGIYFFSLGSLRAVIGTMYALVATIHALLGFAIITGLIADHGIISMAHARPIDQVGVISVIEFLYFITFYTARSSSRVTFEVMQQLEQAVRGVAQREALLAEARAELDRALKIGGPGRFTDQTVGSYKLGVLIGRGGMGEVYEGHSTAGATEAAVKLLHAGTLAEPTHVARFIREAQTASKLASPNVVRVLEVGTTAGEVPFLAMERLRGNDLAQHLRRVRKLALPDAAVLAREVAAGLEAARAAGIVHRDLKPHNVFGAETGDTRTWKILDFGVSKSGGSGTLTKGHVIGTPAYMAPEQAKGEDVDHRADVYSLAAILFRAVTGHPAFTGKDVPTTLYDVVYRIPTQPSILAALPADIDRVLALGLAKTPADRFATALELATWFELAVTDGLSHEQRQRADDLLGRHPWGTRQT